LGPGARDASHQSSLSAAHGGTRATRPPALSAPLSDDRHTPGARRSTSPPSSPAHHTDTPGGAAQDHGSRQASPARHRRRREDSPEEEREESTPSGPHFRRHHDGLRPARPDEPAPHRRPFGRGGPHLQPRSRPLADIEHDYLKHATQMLEDAGPRGVSWQEMRVGHWRGGGVQQVKHIRNPWGLLQSACLKQQVPNGHVDVGDSSFTAKTVTTLLHGCAAGHRHDAHSLVSFCARARTPSPGSPPALTCLSWGQRGCGCA
jgi:hypothetical protein